MNSVDALDSTARDCADEGLDINADLAGTAHFGGPANQGAAGHYYVMDMEGSTWGEPVEGEGYTWSKGYAWGRTLPWWGQEWGGALGGQTCFYRVVG